MLKIYSNKCFVLYYDKIINIELFCLSVDPLSSLGDIYRRNLVCK